MPHQHKTTVEEQDDQTFDASCSCGWDDPGFEDRNDAEAATGEHLAGGGVRLVADEWAAAFGPEES